MGGPRPGKTRDQVAFKFFPEPPGLSHGRHLALESTLPLDARSPGSGQGLLGRVPRFQAHVETETSRHKVGDRFPGSLNTATPGASETLRPCHALPGGSALGFESCRVPPRSRPTWSS